MGNKFKAALFFAACLPLAAFAAPDWSNAGQIILDGVNAVRAQGRTCGAKEFPAAPPLRWNPQLETAALTHSQDMAAQRYFSHADKEGTYADVRSRRAGYAWQRIGENLAFGQDTPQAALEGWLASPGHCANIMNPNFTEMGAAFGLTADKSAGVYYWTQMFGTPRSVAQVQVTRGS
jgi:uncharacterized protein YkwD